MPDENKCDICGRSFDSKRGLSVHKSQAHDGEENEEEENMTETDNSNEDVQTVNLSLKHAMVGVFVLGLSLGFAGGQLLGGPTVIQGTNGDVVDQPADNSDSNQDTEGTQVSGSTPKEVFQNIANNIGADSKQMTSCFEDSTGQESSEDSSEIDSLTQRVINERGINRRPGIGTPTFLIGNDEIGYELVSGAQPVSNLQPVIEEQLSEAKNPESDTIENGTPFKGGTGEVELKEVSLEGEPTQGSTDAPIKFIEFSDFGCPWCAEWHGVDAIPNRDIDSQQPYQTLKSDYVDTGDVQFYFKDYPVSRLHPNAPDAHKAANCILEQDEELFWEFYDSLFENRGQWNSG